MLLMGAGNRYPSDGGWSGRTLLGTKTPSTIGPELDHVCCCSPTIALCGALVGGTAVAFGDPGRSKNPCQQCFNLAADGAKCPAPMCPGDDRVDG